MNKGVVDPPEVAQSDIDLAVRKRRKRVIPGDRQRGQAHVWRHLGKMRDQRRDYGRELRVIRRDPGRGFRGGRVERDRFGESKPQTIDRGFDPRLDRNRDRRRLQAVGSPQEQLIVKDRPQTPQGVADGRLGEAQLLRHLGRLAPPHQLEKDQQGREVEAAEFQICDIWHEAISVARLQI
jgi:hypothetical protein